MKLRKLLLATALLSGLVAAPLASVPVLAQDAGGDLVATEGGGAPVQTTKKGNSGFLGVIFGSGALGVILWTSLFVDGAIAIYFIVDCFVLIKPEKIMPASLIANVEAAMAEGDVMKALSSCENEPGPMANILQAGFSHVEEGFDVIQEAVNAASDLEQEKLMQRLTWISVCSNLGPSLGLLGTVQGMILTFQALAQGGAGDAAALASSIGQALWTTAGGLIVSIPSITAFYSLRNNANRLILRMTAVTMEFLNGLRNVEVAPEEGAAEMA